MKNKMETVPWPEMPKEISFKIPEELMVEFKNDIRIVVRFPWIVGIPVPEFLLQKLGKAGKLEGFNLMLIPDESNR